MTKLLTYILIILFSFTSSVNACYSLHPNGETSLTLKDTGHNREQITRATIGAGVIEVAQGSDLTGLNRDITKAQEITKDITTGTLDATASIDNRVFTSEGRAEIAREHKKAGSFIENVSSNLYNAMAKDTKFADAMKSIKFEETSKLAVERLLSQDGGKEALEIISGQKQVSPEEKDLALSKFAGEFADITGVDIGDVKTMLSMEAIGGSFDKDGKDIYLNDNYVSGDVESGLGVFGHEIGHSMYGDDEATAGYLGSRFADAYTDGLWINGEDYSLGNWNVADGNSLYVVENGVDFSGVKNRDDFEPISLTLTGLTVAGSLYSIQDSARKIYSWIEGEGYKGNTTYVDPIDGRTYTAEGNIKEGAIELATAAAISGAFKVGGKVVGKIKATKVLGEATEVTKNAKIPGSEIKSVIPNIENTANHIFFNKLHDHKLDKILEKYSGDAIKATEDIAKSVNNYLSSNTVGKGIQDISVKVSNVNIVVRGKVENNMFKISTAWLKE